ncbi:FHA domain-containing protein [Caldichromatium japonicum]|uniref:FHA domain-containing protein n=1 Tax=Caldichromatium japonicum TaxID=2699430 RepID=A0A6G7VE21_9GAMM|nr:FHA domain-containing protein [Caldichromatium japonicum]QIK38323.1 FHA domain-containing protein [Caldichromatium japonicum]
MSGDQTSGVGKLPARIEGLINASGRADPRLLERVAASCSEAEFVRFMRHPVLVGSAIQAGLLYRQTETTTAINKTFVFTLTDQDPLEGSPEAIKRAIYLLTKRPDASTATHLLTIGRISDNDLVIPDMSISKRHAIIEIMQDGYWIRDCDSTNGTLVNDIPVGHKPVLLQDGDIISLARYEFVFLTPASLYARLVTSSSQPG